jgi:cell wall-associated NlpC family hydrolase
MGRAIAIGLLALALSACAGARPPVHGPTAPGFDYDALIAAPARPIADVRQRVIRTATSLLGTPYHFGGTTPAGFDCTGYIAYVFRQAAGMDLPRRSVDQVRSGEAITPVAMQPGDLVYFRIEREKSLHLGIYLGEGRFIHAPSTNGAVNTQSLGTTYWRTRFLGARRMLPI